MQTTQKRQVKILKNAEYMADRLSEGERQVKDNELEKVISFLKMKAEENPGIALSELKRLLSRFISTRHFSRSGSIKGYYRTIESVLKDKDYSFVNAKEAIETLGWARRLLRYKTEYKRRH